MIYLDKYGWPVERVKGRWFFNLLRLFIHTRQIKRGRFEYQPVVDEQMNTNTDSN